MFDIAALVLWYYQGRLQCNAITAAESLLIVFTTPVCCIYILWNYALTEASKHCVLLSSYYQGTHA